MRSRVLIFDGSFDRKRKQFQKDTHFWNSPWAISCDLPQSLKLMAFFLPIRPASKRVKKKIKKIAKFCDCFSCHLLIHFLYHTVKHFYEHKHEKQNMGV
jgi:hypothetical protein